jgi:hypothetical protein
MYPLHLPASFLVWFLRGQLTPPMLPVPKQSSDGAPDATRLADHLQVTPAPLDSDNGTVRPVLALPCFPSQVSKLLSKSVISTH